MFGRNRAKRLLTSGVGVAAALVLASPSSWANPAETSAASESAVWVQKEVNFRYVGFTTKYSCDGLRDRVRRALLELGARDDLRLAGYGCVGANAPETAPGVRIVMHVLQPATATPGQTVTAQWKRVDLLNARDVGDPLDAALDCELTAQLKRDLLPLFAVRNVDYSASCSANTPLIGGTRLKTDVLVADTATAAR